jgi:hypothetical protein
VQKIILNSFAENVLITFLMKVMFGTIYRLKRPVTDETKLKFKNFPHFYVSETWVKKKTKEN